MHHPEANPTRTDGPGPGDGSPWPVGRGSRDPTGRAPAAAAAAAAAEAAAAPRWEACVRASGEEIHLQWLYLQRLNLRPCSWQLRWRFPIFHRRRETAAAAAVAAATTLQTPSRPSAGKALSPCNGPGRFAPRRPTADGQRPDACAGWSVVTVAAGRRFRFPSSHVCRAGPTVEGGVEGGVDSEGDVSSAEALLVEGADPSRRILRAWTGGLGESGAAERRAGGDSERRLGEASTPARPVHSSAGGAVRVRVRREAAAASDPGTRSSPAGRLLHFPPPPVARPRRRRGLRAGGAGRSPGAS
jgi:hypothetical protein